MRRPAKDIAAWALILLALLLLALLITVGGCTATGFRSESMTGTPNGHFKSTTTSGFYRNVNGQQAAAMMEGGSDLIGSLTQSPLTLLLGSGLVGGALGKSQGRHAGWEERVKDEQLAKANGAHV